MRTKNIDGTVYKLIEVKDACITNQEHFESALGQLVDHFSPILDDMEIRAFIYNVLKERNMDIRG